jgi:outer membrane protein assembly factor BamB
MRLSEMRRPIGWCGVILAGLLLSLANVWAGDWPQFLGPNRDSHSSETGLVAAWLNKGPRVLWERPVGEGYSGPVIAGNRLVVFHRHEENEVVDCLDAATGAPTWHFAYPTGYRDDFGKGNGPRSTPTIAGDRVYALGAEGFLHCLDLATGKVLWQRALNEDYHVRKGFFGVATSPLVEGKLLLINVGGRGAGIVALDRETGKEVWKATDDEASYSSPIAATIDGVRYVFFFTRSGLVALDPQTGRVRHVHRWRSRMNASVNAAVPVLVGDKLFLSASYGTGAVLLRIGKDGVSEVWHSDDALANHYNTSVYHDGHLYGFDGRQEEGARLRCIDAETGKVCWTKEGFGCGSMILADGKLIVLSESGELILVQPTPIAYKEKARAAVLTRPCRSEIALANGRLYARDGGKLVCWNLKP